MSLPRRTGPLTAALLVVASMVGTGIFTTTGFLLRDLGNPAAVLACWAVGGLVAVAGALSYGELAAALPENGGEYYLLSRAYHPALGLAAGLASLLVGFSAPAAASSLAFAIYLDAVFPGLPHLPVAAGLLLLLSALHALRVSAGNRFQDAATLLKLLLLLGLVAAGLTLGRPSRAWEGGLGAVGGSLLGSPFAVGLIYVSFAYSGWNAAAYVAGELREPGRNLGPALLAGTLAVTLLYLGVNVAFFAAAPPEQLAGRVEVADVAARSLLGPGAARLLSASVALGLVPAVGAMIVTGPRIYESMGRHYGRLAFLGARAPESGPYAAIALQAGLSLLMLLTASFDALLTYIGFTDAVFAALTVLAVPWLRWREPELPRPFRAWGAPWTPLLAAGLLLWSAAHTLLERPASAWAGLATAVLGLLLYAAVRSSRRPGAPRPPEGQNP